MSELKKMYVVSGSEDGILGLCSNLKKAYEVATDYIKEEDMTDMSYAKLCKEFRPSKDYYYNRKECTIYSTDEYASSVTIVMLRVNSLNETLNSRPTRYNNTIIN